MMVPISHMIVFIITLLGTLNFYLLTLDITDLTYNDIYITFDNKISYQRV